MINNKFIPYGYMAVWMYDILMFISNGGYIFFTNLENIVTYSCVYLPRTVKYFT